MHPPTTGDAGGEKEDGLLGDPTGEAKVSGAKVGSLAGGRKYG